MTAHLAMLGHTLAIAKLTGSYYLKQLHSLEAQILVRWVGENPNHLVRPKVLAFMKEGHNAEALELVERHLPALP